MFDLETAIREWKREFTKHESIEDGPMADMETLLRDAYLAQLGSGLDSQAAFRVALGEVGDAAAIAGEYRKNRTVLLNRRSPLRLARFMPALAWNYLKIALRRIRRHKGYSFINLFGLAVGMVCVLFILFWVRDELSFDRFHVNADTLFQVQQDQETSQGRFHVVVTPFPLGPLMQSAIPEIEAMARVTSPGTLLVRYGKNAFFERRVSAVDPQFLGMFTFPLLKGNAMTALNQPGSLVITAETAVKYFGGADPIGKTVTINNTHMLTVTGVLKSIPQNSSLVFDMLVPLDFVRALGQYSESMDNNSIGTYVLLHAPGAATAVAQKITALVRERKGQKRRSPAFSLMRLVDLRLFGYSGFGRDDLGVQNVYAFSMIALFVLLIACINFMNLATARSANRAKEIGLRKVAGAQRRNIVWQFYGESILTTCLTAGIAMILVLLLIPAFNALSGKLMRAADLLSGANLMGIAAVTFLTGIIAGSYPALFLSSFQPIQVLKSGKPGGAKNAKFRKLLVIIQFSLSILLLIGTGVVSRQINFLKHKELGYDKQQLVYVPLRDMTNASYAAFKAKLLQYPRILGVTATHQPPTDIGTDGSGAQWDGQDPTKDHLICFALVDYDYPETLKIEMAAGRTFSPQHATDNGHAWMVNEEAARLLGVSPAEAVGKRFNWLGCDGPIVGVMKNYHFYSVRDAIDPLVVRVDLDSVYFATIRLQAGEIPAALEDVKRTWRQMNPQYPLEYRFFDEDFDRMFRADERLKTLLTAFAGLAIIIACLGLFGLASFMAEQRTREIGIRRVLGASSPAIVRLLSQEFLRWVLLSNVFAWPAAYFLMRGWLQTYAYRISLGIGIFALCGFAALLMALLTVGYQAVHAARKNPVMSLRYE